jgi:hypothetical protein
VEAPVRVLMTMALLGLMACSAEEPEPVVMAPTQGHYTQPVKTPDEVKEAAMQAQADEELVAVAEAGAPRPRTKTVRRYGPSSSSSSAPSATVVSDVDGDALPDSLAAGASRYHGQIDYCISLARKDNPTMNGRMEIAIDVSGGRTTAVEVISNTTGNNELASCAVKKIKRWRFADSVKGQFNWPFMIR